MQIFLEICFVVIRSRKQVAVASVVQLTSCVSKFVVYKSQMCSITVFGPD